MHLIYIQKQGYIKNILLKGESKFKKYVQLYVYT